jgi:hypothetical protein
MFSVWVLGFFPHTYIKIHYFTCSEHKAPDNSEVHREVQSVGFSLWNMLHVTLQALRIWRCPKIFGKFCLPLL